MKKIAWIPREHFRKGFREALASSWFYVLVGLGLSVLCFAAGYGVEHFLSKAFPRTLGLSKALEHLGMGFLVSSIAVFFYEWGAHMKHTMELSHDLAERLKNIELVAESVGKQAIEEACKSIRLSDSETKCLENCKDLVLAIIDLHQEKEGAWASKQCIGFVSGLLEIVVSENVKHFKALASVVRGEQVFEVPRDAALITDTVLATQMAGMKSGDTYQVISDLYSWTGPLPKFLEATENALREGVDVKRIFNLLLDMNHPQRDMTEEEIRRVLKRHVELIKKSKEEGCAGNYTVKILGEEELNSTGLVNDDDLRDRIRYLHGGVFRHRNEESGREEFVRFRVISPHLDTMGLCRDVSRITVEDLIPFEKVWREDVTDLTESSLELMVAKVTKITRKRDKRSRRANRGQKRP